MICPSILSADFSSLKEILKQMEESGIQVVHFDVMDNHFVPNLTFGAKLIADLRPHSSLLFDAHLMIENPQKDLNLYLDAGADFITVHYEACLKEDLKNMADKVHSANKKLGISIKPQTPPQVLDSLLPFIDLVLVMSVEPGFGGQKMIPHCLDKLCYFNKKQKEENLSFIVQVDGGVNRETFEDTLKAGAHWLVIGSAFFKEKTFDFYPKWLEEVLHAKR